MTDNLSHSEQIEQKDIPDYKNLNPPIVERTVDLLNRVILEVKIAKMLHV